MDKTNSEEARTIHKSAERYLGNAERARKRAREHWRSERREQRDFRRVTDIEQFQEKRGNVISLRQSIDLAHSPNPPGTTVFASPPDRVEPIDQYRREQEQVPGTAAAHVEFEQRTGSRK